MKIASVTGYARNYTYQLQALPDRYLTAQKRLEYALNTTRLEASSHYSMLQRWTKGQRVDAILSKPASMTGAGSRLIVVARRMEEAAELFADLSSTAESAIQHFWCGNKEFGFRLILASAAGRWVSSLLQIASLQGFKLIGTSLYAGSGIASLLALAINKGGFRQANLQRLETNVLHTEQFSCSLKKEYVHPINQRGLSPIRRKVSKWTGQSFTRHSLSKLLRHPQQYSRTASQLAKTSHWLFKVVNKLGGSWDKHLAFWMARQAEPLSGLLLAGRLCLCLGSLASVGLNYALTPFSVSVTSIALAGCTAALIVATGAILVMAARGWKGYIPDQVLGKVTPC